MAVLLCTIAFVDEKVAMRSGNLMHERNIGVVSPVLPYCVSRWRTFSPGMLFECVIK